jgi:hypothetical protein
LEYCGFSEKARTFVLRRSFAWEGKPSQYSSVGVDWQGCWMCNVDDDDDSLELRLSDQGFNGVQ